MSGWTMERTVNIATILTCLLVGGAAVKYIATTPSTQRVPQSTSAPQSHVEPGDKVWLPDKAKGKPALVIYLSPDCKYCAASIPLYRELSERDDIKTGKVALVFASSWPEREVKTYLNENQLPAQSFVDGTAAGIRTTLTPTVIVVNADGAVRSAWSGQLTDEGESVLGGVLDEIGGQRR